MEDKSQMLNLKQTKAIMALLSESTIKQAAEKAGIGETTLYRWLQEKEFDEAFKNTRRMALSQTVARLQQTTTSAVDALRSVMEDMEAPASSRVTAAKTVLEMAFKVYEMETLASQIEEIQQYIEETKVANK